MPRRLLDVRISGLNQDHLRRWKSHAPRDLGRALLVNLILFTVVFWLVPNLVPESSVEQGGEVVRGSRIVLIQDTSKPVRP